MKKILFLLLTFFSGFTDIPKNIHFIWLGPKDINQEAKKNIMTWAKMHPDFEVKLWTDLPRNGFNHSIIQEIVNDDLLGQIKNFYEKSTNFGEKAHLLKYQILNQFGGVYLEPDLVYQKNIRELLKQKFFAAISGENIPIIGKEKSIANYILASEPKNLVVDMTIKKIKQDFDEINEAFPGSDPESIIYRINYKTLRPLDHVIELLQKQKKLDGTIYPAHYFHALKGKSGVFATHLHQMNWNSTETEFDRYLKGQILKAEKKIGKIKLILIWSISFLILFELYAFFFTKKSRKKQKDLT